MKRVIYILAVLLFGFNAWAQTPPPAQPQSKAILLKGGVAHLGDGSVIQNSLIGFDDGKITLVADATRSKIDIVGYKVIDIQGQHVYPGFILPNTSLGLQEVSSIDAMTDNDEVGEMNPNVHSQIAYNTDSKITPTLRYNGILIAEPTPVGGRISGSSSVMNLDGWNWEDATLKKNIGVHLNWPRKVSGRFDLATFSFKREPNKKYDGQVQELEAFFEDAISYSKLSTKERNLKLEAMEGLFDGSKILFIHVSAAKEIVDGVRFAQKKGVQKIVVVSGTNALDVSEFLAKNKIPVVLPPVHALPDNEDMDVYLPFKLPYLLTKAGVTVALSHKGMLASARNIPFYAGSAAAYGLTKEQAVQLVTLNAAKVLGIDDKVGTLTEGKHATLFVSRGDALDMMTNDLSYAFIDGKQIVLENEQQALYHRYSKKYKSE